MTPGPEQVGSGCCGVRRAGRFTSFASEWQTWLKAAAAEQAHNAIGLEEKKQDNEDAVDDGAQVAAM